MQETALVDILNKLNMEDNITIPATTRGSDDILVEREWNKDDDGDEVDGSADGAHALGD